MARITVEDCLDQEPNRFALVLLAAKRAKQLLTGSPTILETKRDNKSIVTSLREIAGGKVRFKTEADLEEDRKLALLAREEELAREADRKSRFTRDSGGGSSDAGGSGGESDSSENGENKSVLAPVSSENGDDSSTSTDPF